MQFSGPDLFNYFTKCLTMNALAEWHIVTMFLQEEHTKELFLIAHQAWLDLLLPHDAFLFQKEWMNNVHKKPFTMRDQEYGNCLCVFINLSDLFPHSGEDRNITDSELKTIFLNAMPIVWQQPVILQKHSCHPSCIPVILYSTNSTALVHRQRQSPWQFGLMPILSPIHHTLPWPFLLACLIHSLTDSSM